MKLEKAEEKLEKDKEALDKEKNKVKEKNLKELKPYLVVARFIPTDEDSKLFGKGPDSEDYSNWKKE